VSSRPGLWPAALSLAFALAGCAPGLPQPQPADARAAQLAFPGTTEADLERGRTSYVHRCAACHMLHRPSELPPARWPAVVGQMTARAKLSAVEAADITRYLVVLARIR
jgi:Dihaem cytochrome c